MATKKEQSGKTGARVRVTQVRSVIGRPEIFRRAMEALGLRKIGTVKEFTLSPSVEGMIDRVQNVVEVERLG